MKRIITIILSMLTVCTAIMGWYDGGDMTAAFMCGLLLLSVIFDKEERDDAL